MLSLQNWTLNNLRNLFRNYKKSDRAFSTRVYLDGLNYHVRDHDGAYKYSSGYIENAVQEAVGGVKNNKNFQQKVNLYLGFDRNSKLKEHSICYTTGNVGCIDLPNWTVLKLNGKITLANNTNKDIITNASGATGNCHCAVIGESVNSEIDGNGTQQSAGAGIKFISSNPDDYPWSFHLKNISLRRTKQNGVHLEGQAGGWNQFLVENIGVKDAGGNGLYTKYVVDSAFKIVYLGGALASAYLQNTNVSKFLGCYFGSGAASSSLELNACNTNVFQSCRMDYAYYNLVRIATGICWRNIFSGCRLSNASRQGAGNYSGILLSGADVQNNIFGDDVFYKAAAENNYKYCIEEATGTDGNIFHGLNLQNYSLAGLLKIGVNSKADAGSIIGTIV